MDLPQACNIHYKKICNLQILFLFNYLCREMKDT
jgi:hypothetical protein